MSAEKLASFFLISSVTELLSAQLCSRITGIFPDFGYVMIIGLLMTAVSLALSGPMFPMPWEWNSLSLIAIRQVILGSSFAPQSIAAFVGGSKELESYGYPNNTMTKTAFTACILLAMSLGQSIGPVFGGLMLDASAFSIGSAALFAFSILQVCSHGKMDSSSHLLSLYWVPYYVFY